MLLIKNNKIEEKCYSSLVIFLFNCCDVVTFNLPKFSEKRITEKNRKYFPNQKLGIFPHAEDEEFNNYKQKIEKLITPINHRIIRCYDDVEYCGSIRGYNAEIYNVSFLADTIGFFMQAISLYNWLYPNLPEDLSFYKKGKCFLRSIAHEKRCWIFTDDEFDKIILKKIGLKFTELPDGEIPTLNYTIEY